MLVSVVMHRFHIWVGALIGFLSWQHAGHFKVYRDESLRSYPPANFRVLSPKYMVYLAIGIYLLPQGGNNG